MNEAFKAIVFLLYCHHLVSSLPSEIQRGKRQSFCSFNEFRCNSGQCIDSSLQCDGKAHCLDSSDETQRACAHIPKCPSYTFRCKYGACIFKNATCDGKQDCLDNSDELLPNCPNSQKPKRTCESQDEDACDSGQCIDRFSFCDGAMDCRDGSDETISRCVMVACPSYAFQCAYGGCISMKKLCNERDDCLDGSDESDPSCFNSTQVPEEYRPPKPTGTNEKQEDECFLPEKPIGGRYEVTGCRRNDNSPKCRGVSGTAVPAGSVLTFACNRGYVLEDRIKRIHCLSGTWDPEPLECLKMCKPLISTSTDVICNFKGEEVPCNVSIRPFTKARPKCKDAYHESDPSASFLETECRQDGKWAKPLFECIPDCGKPSPLNDQPLISFGKETKVGEFPWHAGLYSQEGSEMKYLCGGTIISPHMVLTAAHCIYLDGPGTTRDPNSVSVAVGKFTRDWDSKDAYEQRSAVKQIIKPIAYEGKTTSYAQDIAVLHLVISIKLNNIVLPVCIHWATEMTLRNGDLGTAAGWGLNENKEDSKELKSIQLPYIDYESCRKKAPSTFRRYLTYDKFCAGFENGTGVRSGDSGGGLTFTKNDNHFIYGIVSLKEANVDTFALFTNVMNHKVWLEKVMKAVDKAKLKEMNP